MRTTDILSVPFAGQRVAHLGNYLMTTHADWPIV